MTTELNEMVPTIDTIYDDYWSEGKYTAQETLSLLCQFIGQAQDVISPIEENIKKARIYISEIVEALGGKAEVSNFGKLEITSPSVTYTYDKKLLDKLTNQLRTEGLGDVAARLDQCLKPSERAGSLRITRTKEAGEVIYAFPRYAEFAQYQGRP